MAYWVLKAVLTPILRLCYRVEVHGRRHLPRHGPVIVAANHQSFIDSIFIPLVLRRRVTFVAKAEYFENPRTAWFFRAMGQIPIKRGNGNAAARALESAREVLEAGGVLGIYPEGTRSPDGRLYRGRTGVARLALVTGAPVVPVALTGTREVQPIDALRPRFFRSVRVDVGEPLRFDGPAGGTDHPGRTGELRDDLVVLRAATDRIMAAIAALSGQERVDAYANRAGRDGEVVTLPAEPGRAGPVLEPATVGARAETPASYR